MTNITEELRQLRKAIGSNIHQQRLARKLTLRKFSRYTGISMEKLDQYEMGKNQIQLEELLLIADRLGTQLAKLIAT